MCAAPSIYKYPSECLFSSIEHFVEAFVVMNMVVCEVEQPRAYFVVPVHLVVAGGSLVIGIRGRLIPQRFHTWKYVAVVGGSLVMWDAFLHPVVLG